jgi:4-aminobutyrate aminotransferase-like enzyme
MSAQIPGPRTQELLHVLQAFESRNVTYAGPDFPVFWASARDAEVTDVDGNVYLDLTAAFGVANAGHANPAVAAAIADQAKRLMHAMGDVHPTEIKIRLLEDLARIAPGELSKTFLSSTGSEAVEAAMKTAMLATGKTAFAAFLGSYHGLSLGALTISGIDKFRAPFSEALPARTLFLEYPRGGDAAAALEIARSALRARTDLAALLIEPIQGRGGCIVPPGGYLRGLREICRECGILLVFDEIYTGFGRTGTFFACEQEGVVPDILCIGKAMGNGFPISAAIARPEIMDAWPLSSGEALHTSTYLGNPMGCAAARATLREIERLHLCERARELGALLGARLASLRDRGKARAVRGRGLMWGIELSGGAAAARVVKEALASGMIVLQSGPEGNVISITPPLVIAQAALLDAIDRIEALL